MLFGLVLELFNLQIKFTVKSRAGEPETVVLAAQSWSRLMKRSGAGAAQKKSGAGAAQKNNREPEPPKLGNSGSGSIWLIIKQILKIISFF